jgi:hypothetical protein
MKFLPFALFTLFSISLTAQSIIKDHPFGGVTREDLEMKDCAFDKNAGAVALFDVQEERIDAQYVSGDGAVRHMMIKILNESGLDQANFKIDYIQTLQSVGDIRACTYNLDKEGKMITIPLDKKSLYTESINKWVRELSFTFPQVKPGSVLELEYSLESFSAPTALSGTWFFQHAIPTKFSSFRINYPESIQISASTFCYQPVQKEMDNHTIRTIQTFTMTDIPGLRQEPYISSEGDYLQKMTFIVTYGTLGRINFSGISSWPGMVKRLMSYDLYGGQLKKDLTLPDDYSNGLAKAKGPLAQMQFIYRYVQQNMEWDGEGNLHKIENIRSVWKNRRGSLADINLLLVNLLRQSGLNASPLLVSSRKHGKIRMDQPGLLQFDRLMAYVIIEDKSYFLDAAFKEESFRLIPEAVMYTQGLLLKDFNSYQWGWLMIWDDIAKYKNMVAVNAEIQDENRMAGTVKVYSYDYSRQERLKELKRDKKAFLEKYFVSGKSEEQNDSLTLTNEDIDSLPLIQEMDFKNLVNASGKFKYFSLNLFSGLEKNPFLADTRFSDICFGIDQSYMVSGNFSIPDGYSFEEVPKNVGLIMPDTSIIFTRVVQVDKDQLSSRLTLEFRKPVFPVSQYTELKDFYNKLFAYLNEQVVIKKN